MGGGIGMGKQKKKKKDGSTPGEDTIAGLHPQGFQALYLSSLKTEEFGVSNRDISGT